MAPAKRPSGWQKVKGIFTLPESPHAVALGAAIGLLFAFTPTPGMQTIIALALAVLFGASKGAALAMVWISNPLTAAPIYAASYSVGLYLVPNSDLFTTTILGGFAIGVVSALLAYPLIYHLRRRTIASFAARHSLT